MKTSAPVFIAVLSFFLNFTFQGHSQDVTSKSSDQHLAVLVKYKTQPLKSKEAVAGMTKLIEAVKTETNFVSITILTDKNDPSVIMLYEEWSNEAYYYGDHMKTNHLQEFIIASRDYLIGPPEITGWKIEKKFAAE
jgi:quinol monooxygenase YgiN